MGNASSAAPSMKPPAETSSSCQTQCITAAHNFEVIHFSLLEGMGVGKFVSSRNFRVGGHDWNISLYPDGCTAAHKDKVSAFLIPQGGGQEGARVRFTFTVSGKDGKAWKKENTEHTFTSPLTGIGWPDMIDKSDPLFRTLLRRSNDRFTVRCALTVISESQSEEEFPEPNMQQHFEQMLKAGKGKDVTFDVGGQIFHAHRCVLAARSPVFEAELFGPMKEKATVEPISVADMEPSVFEELLHFIYTDSISSERMNGDDVNVFMQHLLVAADLYGLDRLRLMCEVSLCHGIDAQTVATTLVLAEQHNCARLKDACLKFVASSRHVLGVIVKTEGFKHLMASCPSIAVQIISDKIAEAYACTWCLDPRPL